jgi:hypothetical protein
MKTDRVALAGSFCRYSGSIGSWSQYENHDASDCDVMDVDYHTSLDVWYWPPYAGFVDIWIKARCASAYSGVWLNDEYGWSDSDVYMRSAFTVNVSPAEADEDQREIWWMDWGGNPDNGSWNNNWWPPWRLVVQPENAPSHPSECMDIRQCRDH